MFCSELETSGGISSEQAGGITTVGGHSLDWDAHSCLALGRSGGTKAQALSLIPLCVEIGEQQLEQHQVLWWCNLCRGSGILHQER